MATTAIQLERTLIGISLTIALSDLLDDVTIDVMLFAIFLDQHPLGSGIEFIDAVHYGSDSIVEKDCQDHQ